jgi:Tol biopolymer transport system component
VPVLGLGDELALWSPTLSPDELSLYFGASGDERGEEIYVATRADLDAPFSGAEVVASVSSPSADGTPFLSVDGSTLLFYSTRPGGVGDRDLWRATRTTPGGAFQAPEIVPGLNSATIDYLATLSGDGLTLLFVSTRDGGHGGRDIWQATRARVGDEFGGVENVAALNTPDDEGRAQISADGLSVYFASGRPGTLGDLDLWMATRGTPDEEFSNVTNLAALNDDTRDFNLALSPSELELYFSTHRFGAARLMRSTRRCE